MFDFLFKNKEMDKSDFYNKLYLKIKELYEKEKIDIKRKEELSNLIEKYGYLPYSQSRAIKELTPTEVIFCLEKKLELNSGFKNGKLFIKNNKISVLERLNIKNSDWIKKEQHEIKLINLAALGDRTINSKSVNFIDWLRQIIILPTGNIKNNVLPTTLYLIPFTPRDFGNAYIIAESEDVSSKLQDKKLKSIDISAKNQVKLFITLAQLASHPVIYDIVPNNARFSKTVLAHCEMFRWIDVNFLIEEISKSLNDTASKLFDEFDEDDVNIVKNIYKTTLKSGSVDLSSEFMPIYNKFTQKLVDKRKELSAYITTKEQQTKLHKRIAKIISKIENKNYDKIKHDKDITKRGEIINALINEGLWTLPEGAWCSSSVPVFEKMSEGAAYPIFSNYNDENIDVSECSEADCETPFYFAYLENGKINNKTINFFINYLESLQQEFNFDGFRISHTDFIVDELSEKSSKPISCRMPKTLITKINETMKKKMPYFALIAEYRLWNSFLKEYHQDMKFDILWGNDTKTDYEKKPNQVISDNIELQNYNRTIEKKSYLSILKTYNNQDGEFRTVNRNIALEDKNEALFKWFKFKFLPGGKFAQRPVLYVDGDETFSKDGIEPTIKEEISMLRSYDEDFYSKFDAIRRFALNNEITLNGEAQIIKQQSDGFVSWIISKEALKESFIIAANYLPLKEKILTQNNNGISQYYINTNQPVENKKIEIPSDYKLVSEFVWKVDKKEFIEHYFSGNIKTIKIPKLLPSEFLIYKIKR